MRVRFLATAMAVAVTLPGSASAQIFDTDFGAMVLNQNIGAINTYNTQIDRINNEQRDADSRRNGRQQSTQPPNPPIPAATMEQLKSAVVAILDPEYGRRLAAYGPTRSQNWVSSTLKSVGAQVGSLSPEYHRRVRSGGQRAADSWLVSRTRQIASGYVNTGTNVGSATSDAAPASAMNRAGTAASQAIPDSVLNRTQAAAFVNLQSEYNRRISSFGRANADRWMNAAAREVGRQTGALGPEYLERVRRQGGAQAADWYEAQAREISRRYVENGQQ